MTWLMAAQATPQQTMLGEAAEHPRIAKAIVDLEDAIQYMEAAPHNFGGHKAAAIADCRRAVTQLKLALAFRTKSDNRRGR
jgi:hypothetical protein